MFFIFLITVFNSEEGTGFITISDILEHFHGEIIRYFLLQTHYRAPLNFKYKYLNDAKSSLSRLYRAVDGFKVDGNPDEKISKYIKNDLNSPKAISRAHYLSEQSNKGSREAGQLLKNSSLYNPLRRPELVLKRRNVVFNQMHRG